MGAGIDFFFFILLAAIAVSIYFIPLFVAYAREHENLTAIAALNTLLGWSIFGWVAALVWACIRSSKQENNEIEQLERLSSLRKSGALTEDDFEHQKRKILG